VCFTANEARICSRIVEEHLLKGRPVTKYLFGETVTEKEIKPLEETTFYKKQMRVALRNCGIIDPEDIEEAIAMGAYEALGKVLTTMTPEQVIDEMKKSGLRGRGGGGFPTGLKWEFAYKQKETPKYVVCNADEGDPGAFMDRSIMEGDPTVCWKAWLLRVTPLVLTTASFM